MRGDHRGGGADVHGRGEQGDARRADRRGRRGRPRSAGRRRRRSRTRAPGCSSAATMPISSPLPSIGAAAVSGSSPPSSTWRPASRVGATASSSGLEVLVRSGWVTGTSYWTVIRAVSPSAESRGGETATGVVHGLRAGRSARRARCRWARCRRRRARRPAREALPAPGTCSRSWSMPTWARASGTSQLSSGCRRTRRRGRTTSGDERPRRRSCARGGRGAAAETVEEA